MYYQPDKRKFFEGEVKIRFEAQNRYVPFAGSFPETEWIAGSRSSNDKQPLVIQKAITERTSERLLNEKAGLLKEVVITTKAKNPTEELDKKLSSPLFSNIEGTVIDFVNEKQTSAFGYTNILEWLQGRVAGYTVQNRGGEIVPVIRGSTAQVFLNEIPVDADVAGSIPVADIALIKVVRNSSLGGIGNSASAIVIYTRTGDMLMQNTTPSLLTNVITGYRKQVPYFSPDYSIPGNRDVKDERFVLFHQNTVQPNFSTWKAPIIFYNNDSAKSYRIRITGFTKDGELIASTRLIQ